MPVTTATGIPSLHQPARVGHLAAGLEVERRPIEDDEAVGACGERLHFAALGVEKGLHGRLFDHRLAVSVEPIGQCLDAAHCSASLS